MGAWPWVSWTATHRLRAHATPCMHKYACTVRQTSQHGASSAAGLGHVKQCQPSVVRMNDASSHSLSMHLSMSSIPWYGGQHGPPCSAQPGRRATRCIALTASLLHACFEPLGPLKSLSSPHQVLDDVDAFFAQAGREVKAVTLKAGRTLVLYRHEGKVYCSDVYSTAVGACCLASCACCCCRTCQLCRMRGSRCEI